MKRESIFAQIDHYERFQRKMDERHKKHTERGKRRPNTCFQCRIEIAREKRQAIAEEVSGK